MTLVHNEQTKLTATWLNGIATAVLAVGGFAPTVAATVSSGTVPPFTALLARVCCAGSAVLHLLARLTLRRLRP